MGYKSNYNEEVFKKFEINNRGEYIVMKKLKNAKGQVELYDLRKYFTPEDSKGEIKPTKQGLRLNYENMVEFMEALIKNVDDDVLANLDRLLADGANKKESAPAKPENIEPISDKEAEDLMNINWEDIDM